jgi:hypothetical protein
MIGYRPCAVCVAYVPAATGCKHWKPTLHVESPRRQVRSKESAAAASRALRARRKAELEAARRERHEQHQ